MKMYLFAIKGVGKSVRERGGRDAVSYTHLDVYKRQHTHLYNILIDIYTLERFKFWYQLKNNYTSDKYYIYETLA